MNCELISTLIGAHQIGSTDVDIQWLLTDSRSLCFPEQTLFFAIVTQRGDGHQYIDDLYRQGVRAFVVSRKPKSPHEDAAYLQVPDTLKALQRLAERHREQYDIPVIGIAGSNGKTTVKEWLFQMLSPEKVVTRSPRSYNSQIGVPLSVWNLNEKTEIGVFEGGISKPGEMAAVERIIQPTIGIFTCLGAAHQENFESMEQKCREKLLLFKHAKVLIYPAGNHVLEHCLNEMKFSGRLISVSHDDDAMEVDRLLCAAACRVLGLDDKTIMQRLRTLEPIAMRLEVKDGINGCTVINDAYNSDLTSLDIALDYMHRRPNEEGRRHTLILSDIEQSGLSPRTLYNHVATLLKGRGIQSFIGVGPQLCANAALFTNDSLESHFFRSTESFMQSITFRNLHDEVLLLKGARSFHFELLTEQLEQSVHETILEVNMNALIDNLNHYRSLLKPETRMICMVKAGAYGAGSVEVSRVLQDHKVDYLAVAVADEGVELRRAGITTGIMIMNPEMTSFRTLFRYKLEPEIYSFRLLDALIEAAEHEGVTGFPVHIKLDTGMRRLGFDPERDMPELVARLKRQNAVIPRSVFSHFVGSDSDDFDAFSDHQFKLYQQGADALQEHFSHHILRHMCNSAGIEHFPDRQMDMVRLGLGLYGINPRNNQIINNVSTLRTTILQIHNVSAGESVGYSRKTMLQRDSRIGAIPIGYADGLDRHLGNGHAYCLVNGQKAPYVGNICMDVAMIDLTDVDCQEGDSVEIFGDNLPVTVLSDVTETIPYEILTSVSNRVKRVYFRD